MLQSFCLALVLMLSSSLNLTHAGAGSLAGRSTPHDSSDLYRIQEFRTLVTVASPTEKETAKQRSLPPQTSPSPGVYPEPDKFLSTPAFSIFDGANMQHHKAVTKAIKRSACLRGTATTPLQVTTASTLPTNMINCANVMGAVTSWTTSYSVGGLAVLSCWDKSFETVPPQVTSASTLPTNMVDCANVMGALTSWTTSYSVGGLAVLSCCDQSFETVRRRDDAIAQVTTFTATCPGDADGFWPCFSSWKSYLNCTDKEKTAPATALMTTDDCDSNPDITATCSVTGAALSSCFAPYLASLTTSATSTSSSTTPTERESSSSTHSSTKVATSNESPPPPTTTSKPTTSVSPTSAPKPTTTKITSTPTTTTSGPTCLSIDCLKLLPKKTKGHH